MTVVVPEEQESKPKVARDRIEVTLEHISVRTDDLVTQYPQADSYVITDDGDLVLTNREKNEKIALIRSRVWQEVYFAGTQRVMESFRKVYFDVDGNEIEPDDD